MIKPMIAVSLVAHVLWSLPARCEPADYFSANSFMPGCRSIIEKGPGRFAVTNAQTAFDSGRCVGFVTGIAAIDPGSCAPTVTLDQLLRVVVKYIDERPQLMHERFADLVQQALATAWPCKR